MAEEKADNAPSGSFKLPDWGPPKLRDIWKLIADKINAITPIKGIGIDVDQSKGGSQISLASERPVGEGLVAGGNSSGGRGSPVDISGSLNGQPAVYHLLQTRPPTEV